MFNRNKTDLCDSVEVHFIKYYMETESRPTDFVLFSNL